MLFKFFPEHAQLKEDTAAVFNLSRRQIDHSDEYEEKDSQSVPTIPTINQQLRKLNRTKPFLKISKNRLSTRAALASLQKNRLNKRHHKEIEQEADSIQEQEKKQL